MNTVLIPIKEAAERLHVHPVTLLRAIAAGKLEAVKLGRGYQVTEEAIKTLIENQTVGGTSENADRT